MKTKHFKFIIYLFITILIVFTVFASTSRATISVDSFRPTISTSDNAEIANKASGILGAIQVIGSIVAIACLVIMGIKYMAGSIEDKAEYKKTMIPYIIGAVLLFAASNLVQVLYDLGQSLNN